MPPTIDKARNVAIGLMVLAGLPQGLGQAQQPLTSMFHFLASIIPAVRACLDHSGSVKFLPAVK